jgi:LmbE family N-acetylglucosaminyl deacetylase
MPDAPQLPSPTRVLVITAHPDDVDFGAGGTVATWTDAGVEVVYCIVTDGDAGGFDPAVPRREIAGIRRLEQTNAGKELGVSELHFLGYPDGRLEATLDLRRDLSRIIRTVRPDTVVTQSPERNWASVYGSHPDHRATGVAALDAVYPDARNPYTFTELIEQEGLDAHTVGQVWVMAGPTPNRWVDTTAQFDRKIAALLHHESQHQDPTGMRQRVRAWNEGLAASGGLPAGSTAEVFQILDTR